MTAVPPVAEPELGVTPETTKGVGVGVGVRVMVRVGVTVRVGVKEGVNRGVNVSRLDGVAIPTA
jgi:hypothetical protein